MLFPVNSLKLGGVISQRKMDINKTIMIRIRTWYNDNSESLFLDESNELFLHLLFDFRGSILGGIH